MGGLSSCSAPGSYSKVLAARLHGVGAPPYATRDVRIGGGAQELDGGCGPRLALGGILEAEFVALDANRHDTAAKAETDLAVRQLAQKSKFLAGPEPAPGYAGPAPRFAAEADNAKSLAVGLDSARGAPKAAGQLLIRQRAQQPLLPGGVRARPVVAFGNTQLTAPIHDGPCGSSKPAGDFRVRGGA